MYADMACDARRPASLCSGGRRDAGLQGALRQQHYSGCHPVLEHILKVSCIEVATLLRAVSVTSCAAANLREGC